MQNHPVLKRAIMVAAFIATAAGAHGCLKGGSDTVWGPVVHCAGSGASDAVAEVADTLLNGGTGMDGKLEQLGLSYGKDVIACLVNSLVNEWTSPGAAPDERRLEAAKRGQTFLKAKGVERFE